MITIEKLKIFSSYKGDIDLWARIGSSNEKAIMSDADWATIDSLLQDIIIVSRNLSSKEFSAVLLSRLERYCDSAETITQIKKMAEKQF